MIVFRCLEKHDQQVGEGKQMVGLTTFQVQPRNEENEQNRPAL